MNVKKLSVAALLLVCGLASARAQTFQGISCDDVRRLTTAEQDYWSERLNLSAEQRHHIYVACYQNYRGPRRQDVGPVANNGQ
jgi:hypothetical protein